MSCYHVIAFLNRCCEYYQKYDGRYLERRSWYQYRYTHNITFRGRPPEVGTATTCQPFLTCLQRI